MFVEALGQMLLRILSIPPGTSWKKAGDVHSNNSEVLQNDYVSTMVEITVDDICPGEEPLSIKYDKETPRNLAKRLEQIRDAGNDIVKWVAEDLCCSGVSAYDVVFDKENNKPLFVPHLEDIELYLTDKMELIVYNKEDKDDEKKNLEDILIFVNYNKRDLTLVEDDNLIDKKIKFAVAPCPMQVRNVARTIKMVENIENAIFRYRMVLSRVARWVNVDIGVSQGNKQDDVVDTISSAINSNSLALTGTNEIEFDDNIPVIPNRRGIGKPEIMCDIPDKPLSEVSDLEHFLGKLNLLMRFPGTYMDFSKPLGEAAISLIRGDLRYAKLILSVQKKITTAFNDLLSSSKRFHKYHATVDLQKIPTSEDADVVEALKEYVALADDIESFINADGADQKTRLHRLTALRELYGTATMSPQLQRWFEIEEYYILHSDLSDSDIEDVELSGGSNVSPKALMGEEPSESNEESSEVEPVPDVEIIEPKTE